MKMHKKRDRRVCVIQEWMWISIVNWLACGSVAVRSTSQSSIALRDSPGDLARRSPRGRSPLLPGRRASVRQRSSRRATYPGSSASGKPFAKSVTPAIAEPRPSGWLRRRRPLKDSWPHLGRRTRPSWQGSSEQEGHVFKRIEQLSELLRPTGRCHLLWWTSSRPRSA